MKIADLKEFIPITADDIEVNPTVILENHFFGKHGEAKGYRERAIDFSVKYKLPVSATLNNGYELIQRYIAFSCPKCGEEMKKGTGTGNGSQTTVEFNCDKCKITAHLSIPTPDGISFHFE